VALQIAWMGAKLIRRSINGLMDVGLPTSDVEKVEKVLRQNISDDIHYHALRTRQAGARSFVSVDIQVPGEWSVQKGHDLAEKIEQEIREALPMVTVFTHVEPFEDPRSFMDVYLDRGHLHKKSG
jgi:divalent metal cation (Fe/Co/Zn/Cd) transporter